MEADKDRDGKISFEEFTKMVENTDVSMSMTLGEFPPTVYPTPDILQYRGLSEMLTKLRQINSRNCCSGGLG